MSSNENPWRHLSSPIGWVVLLSLHLIYRISSDLILGLVRPKKEIPARLLGPTPPPTTSTNANSPLNSPSLSSDGTESRGNKRSKQSFHAGLQQRYSRLLQLSPPLLRSYLESIPFRSSTLSRHRLLGVGQAGYPLQSC